MRKTLILLMASLAMIISISICHATVAWEIPRTLKLASPSKDMISSKNGKWIFILTDRGEINIYTSGGQLKDTIHVGNHITQIELGPMDDSLLLNNRQNSTVQVLSIEFLQEIDIAGSPFLGLADVPIVITVFLDYQ